MTRTAVSTPHEADCGVLAAWISRNREALIAVLLSIQSKEAADDEIYKSIDALMNVSRENIPDCHPVGNGATFLPVNLPLYSLVIFAIIPGLFAKKIYVRPPELMRETTASILSLLPKTQLTQALELCFCTRATFMKDYVSDSQFIVFTGTLKNANIIRKSARKDQLFIYNGQGVNPIVITSSAYLASAIEKACKAKRFNSGQDCAAPDAILVHTQVYEAFMEGLLKQVKLLRIGRYKDGAAIGPLIDSAHPLKIAEHIHKWRHCIYYGGKIDVKDAIVSPTIIECPSVAEANTKELFAPIWHVCRYQSDDVLQQYFEQPAYRQYAMYASLFGQSEYLLGQKHTLIINNEIVMDVERGNDEYGGHSIGASFVQFNGATVSRPILISRELKCAFSSILKPSIHIEKAGR